MNDDLRTASFEEFGSDDELAAVVGGGAAHSPLLRSIGATAGDPATVGGQRMDGTIKISVSWSR